MVNMHSFKGSHGIFFVAQSFSAVQHNDCGDAANADHDGSFTVNDCDTQEAQCNSVAGES